jgi:hypothetical protein
MTETLHRHNNSRAGASPSAVEQWRHDVDQLIIAAINKPHRDGRRQPSAQQSCFPSAVHAPSVAQAGACPPTWHRTLMDSYQTSDLREESTAIEVGRTVAPPSSATVRGVETSRVATSRETSTCMH